MIAALRFTSDWPPLWVIGFGLTVALLVAGLYWRETRRLAAPGNYLLPGLRAIAVALTIFILAGPVWHRRTTSDRFGRVIFALDQSQSMSVDDASGEHSVPSRFDRATELLLGDDNRAGLLEQLQSTHATDLILFSIGEVRKVWSSGNDQRIPLTLDLAADGRATDLSAGMLVASDRTGDQRPTAVVLLSDGRGNSGPLPLDVAKSLTSAGVTIHAIGFGSTEEPAAVRIARVDVPTNAFADVSLAGAASIQQTGFSGDSVEVRIEHAGQVVWRESVTLSDAETLVPFDLDVPSILKKIHSVVADNVRHPIRVLDLRAVVETKTDSRSDTSGQDRRAENDSRSFRVAVSTQQNRLLMLDGSSRWETRYLRNLFDRDPAWSVDTVLFGPGTDQPLASRGDQPGQIPASPTTIGRYDAVILGEVPADQWTAADAELFEGYVAGGGGLIVIDGSYGQVRTIIQRSLRDLVPVTYLAGPPLPIVGLRVARAGIDHPALQLWDDPAKQPQLWQQLPPPPWAPQVRASGGAEMLAEVVVADGSTLPWLITRMFGSGRVVYLSTDQTWRWRYKVADRFHAKFWNQLIASVMQPPYAAIDDYVAIGTDKIQYATDETATIRVRLRSSDGKPLSDRTVDAWLVADGKVAAQVPLMLDDAARGTYRGTSGPLPSGDYLVRVQASGFAPENLLATTPIWVDESDRGERSRVALDERNLQQIAAAGGGGYWHESNAEQILQQLEPLSSGQTIESDVLLWQSFYWFIVVIAILTVEWWLRKRAGLI